MKAVSFIRTSPKTLGEAGHSEGYRNPLSLDELFVTHPSSTFFVRVGAVSDESPAVPGFCDESVAGGVGEDAALGVSAGDLLVIDRALQPALGRLVLVGVEGELVLRRYTEHNGKQYVVGGEGVTIELESSSDVVFWGVVKNIVREV
jgi:DNA polymerase V